MFNLLGDISQVLNILCFILSITTVLGYYKSINNKKWLKFSRFSYHSMTIGVILMSLVLLLLITNHQYQYAYIFNNSSNDLPFGYLLSTFYAGQEGSFLLWALFLVLIGIFLIPFTKKIKFESEVMGTFSFVISFLLILIINKSPFDKVWEVFPDAIRTDAIPAGINAIILGSGSWVGIPTDGNGLNPLLQNFWMQIHPPILFLGFALIAIPFAFAIAALLKREYQSWIPFSMPWILLSSSVLGAGIILGGFWAYETLGWGGYWGWDPVENSSLVPWIVTVALLHTAYTQKRTGGLIKTNLLLSIFSFVLVIYSTFLTRSGVLQDSSVHSFTKPGTIVYLLLFLFLIVFLLFGIGLLMFRLKDILKPKSEYKFLSREVALSFGSILLGLSAIIILLGTSYPIFMKSNVDISFYNNWNLPIAILMSLFNGFSLIVKWKENDKIEVIKKSIASLLISVCLTVISFFFGVNEISMLLFVWSSLFALCLNFERLIKVIVGQPIKMGAFVSHIGVALLFLGIVGSGRYSETKNGVQLPLNQPVKAFDYTFTYIGQENFENGKKTYFNVNVAKEGDQSILKPIMFMSQMNNSVMKIPDIKVLALKDLYLAPLGIEEGTPNNLSNIYELNRGEEQIIDGYKVTFLSHEMGEHSTDKMKMGGEFNISAKLNVTDRQGFTEILTLKTIYKMDGPIPEPMITKDGNAEFSLIKIISLQKDNLKAQVGHRDLKAAQRKTSQEILVADISVKPLILLFWIGNIIMTLGFFISIFRRWKELKKE